MPQVVALYFYKCFSITSAKFSLGWKPTTVSTDSPSLNKIKVGILITSNLAAVDGFSSTSSFKILAFPSSSPANSSNTGAIILHGPHQVAQKATKLTPDRSEEHTSELQSRFDLVCRLLLEKKKKRRSK